SDRAKLCQEDIENEPTRLVHRPQQAADTIIVIFEQAAMHQPAEREQENEQDNDGDDEAPVHACWSSTKHGDPPQISAVTGVSTNPRNAARSSAPTAPSTTRWSQDSVTVIVLSKPTVPSFFSTACRRDAPTARMVACGGLMMAENSRTPYMPRLEIADAP